MVGGGNDYMSTARYEQSMINGKSEIKGNLMQQAWTRLFEARCEDLGLKANDK